MDILSFAQQRSKILFYIHRQIEQEKDSAKQSALLGVMAYYLDTHVGIYSSQYIESKLVSIAQSINYMPQFMQKNEHRKERILHIVSQVYNTGGHTRAVNSWTQNDVMREYSLYITNHNSERPQWLLETIRQSGGTVYIDKASTNFIERAKELRRIAAGYDRVVLHIHPCDILPILAFGHQEWQRPVYFFNHADHRFWLGISVSDLILDLSSLGNEFTVKRRGATKTQILPVPQSNMMFGDNFLSRDECRKKLAIPSSIKIVLSMANTSKYRPIPGYNFFQFAMELVKESDNTYVLVIGPSPSEPLWKEAYIRSQGRIRALGEKSKDETPLFLGAADAYVDSFPLSSGTSLIESIRQCIPSFSLRMPWAAFDIYRKLRRESMRALKEDVIGCLQNGAPYDTIKLREKYYQTHCPPAWNDHLNAIFSIPLIHRVTTSFQGKDNLLDFYDRFSFALRFGPSGLLDCACEEAYQKVRFIEQTISGVNML